MTVVFVVENNLFKTIIHIFNVINTIIIPRMYKTCKQPLYPFLEPSYLLLSFLYSDLNITNSVV